MANKSIILFPLIFAVSVVAAVLSMPDADPAPDRSAAGGIQQALEALAVGRAELAERLAAEAAAEGAEGSWRALLIEASARHRLGKYDRAEESYRRFLALCQSPSERSFAMEQINLCRFKAAGPVRTVSASELLTAGRLAKLAKVDNLIHVESSEHFVVRARNSDLAKLVVEQAEVALSRICRIILASQVYPHSVNIHVWPDVEEYRKHATSAPEWAGGGFSIRRDKAGLLVRRIDLTQLDGNERFDASILDRILPHEMCHLVLAEFFGDAPCPLALNEGMAMLAEARADNSRITLTGAALAGVKKIPLRRLLTINRCKSDNAAVFYAESFSLTAYLHSRMTPKQFHKMLAHIKTGCPLDEAVQRALYVPCDEAFLKHLAKAWETEALRQWQFLKVLSE